MQTTAAISPEPGADEHALSPYECLRERNSTRDLHATIDALEPREATIIRRPFGLDGDEELLLEEVARQFGITRERIRRLEDLALRKLRLAMTRQQKVCARVGVELEARQRMADIKEFIESQAKKRSGLPPLVLPRRHGRNPRVRYHLARSFRKMRGVVSPRYAPSPVPFLAMRKTTEPAIHL